jgi:hypothetical protein
LESHPGEPIILTKILTATQGYSEDLSNKLEKQKNKLLENQAFKQLLAYIYLENADQAKYGSKLTGLSTQQLLGNDQYPKIITEANNVLSNHRLDFSKQGHKTYHKNLTKNIKKEQDQEKINLSFAQMKGKCYCCKKTGHKLLQCCFKDKPKAEWAINKVQQSHDQANKTTKKANEESVNQTPKTIKNVLNEASTEG